MASFSYQAGGQDRGTSLSKGQQRLAPLFPDPAFLAIVGAAISGLSWGSIDLTREWRWVAPSWSSNVRLPSSKKSEERPFEAELLAEQVQSLHSMLTKTLVVIPLVVSVLVVTLWDAVPHGNLAGWSAAVIGLSVVRWIVQRSYFRRPARLAQDRWLALFVVLMIPHALMFGLIVWAIFPINDVPLQMLCLIIVAGVAAGGATTLLAHPTVSGLYVALVLTPLALRFLTLDTFHVAYAALTAR